MLSSTHPDLDLHGLASGASPCLHPTEWLLVVVVWLFLQVLPDVLSSFQPDLVLYDAGVDVHVADDLGRLAVTDQGKGCRQERNGILRARVPQ